MAEKKRAKLAFITRNYPPAHFLQSLVANRRNLSGLTAFKIRKNFEVNIVGDLLK